jgi:hypothetical protein
VTLESPSSAQSVTLASSIRKKAAVLYKETSDLVGQQKAASDELDRIIMEVSVDKSF